MPAVMHPTVQDIIYDKNITDINNPSPKLNSSNPVKFVYIIKSIRRMFHIKNKHIDETKQIHQDLKNSLKEFRIKKIARATPGNAGKTKSITF